MPGLNGTGWARNCLTHDSPAARGGSVWWPVAIRKRSATRIALRWPAASAGASSGKNPSTGSSIRSLPSAAAIPTAVEVKLLERE